MRRLIIVALVGVVASLRAEPLPDLAQLKLAAEAGDAVAEFNYGQRLTLSNPKEQFDWYMKSAEQGYAPAQEAVAGNLAGRFTSNLKEKKAFEREAARWVSRAAYQGLASAQASLSQFYNRGLGVAADPLKAYMWIQIAVQTADAERLGFSGMIYKANRDGLIRATPSEIIRLGQKLAREFRPMRFAGMNPVEADLVFASLRLSSIFKINGRPSAVMNNVRFGPGETKRVNVDGQPVRLTCLAIDSKAATFSLTGTNHQAVLQLNH